MQHVAVAGELAQSMQAGCVGLRVDRLHRQVNRHFEQALRPLGLSLPQLEILSALTVGGAAVKPAELATRLGAERSTMSRNLTLMQQRGWVSTTQTSSSGRSMAVAITDMGTTTLAQAHTAWTQAQTAVLALLGNEAPATLDSWLAAMPDPVERPPSPPS